MNFKKKLEREIEKQREKIHQIHSLLVGEQAYLRAQEDMLKLLPKEQTGDSVSGLRPSGDPAKIYEILKNTSRAMHITDILAKLGREVTHDSRSAIAGTLGTYVRKGQVFTRPAPNTFGLVEFADNASSKKESKDDIPADFGKDSEPPPLPDL